jgi:hypothetical protein
VDNVVTGSIGTDALAYDPDNGHFYIGGNSGAIKVYDAQGDEVRLVATPYAIEGLAWDDLSPGGPFLWAWVNAEGGTDSRCEAVQLDPLTGLATGVGFRGEDQGGAPNVPEAVTITRDLVPGKLSLLGLQESDGYPLTGAFAVGYDLDVTLPPAWIDLVGPTAGSVAPGVSDTLRVAIHGTMADTTAAAVIKVGSNDLGQPLVEIPVTTAMLARLVPLDADGVGLPSPLVVGPNVPNPFNPVTSIRFELREAGTVELAIYDLRGRRVAEMKRAIDAPGRHEFVWNGTDDAGVPVASGVYLYELRTGDVAATRKMVLAK